MVKIPTGKITEEEVRSLFECYVGGCVKNQNEKESGQDLVQPNSICKAKVLLAHFVNTKALGAEVSFMAVTNTKPTKMVPVQGKRPLCLKVWMKPKNVCLVDPCLTKGQVLGMAVKRSLDWFSVKIKRMEASKAVFLTGVGLILFSAEFPDAF